MSFIAGLAWFVPVWALIPVHDPMTVLVSPGWFEHWAQLFYLGVITSGVGYGLWYYALSRMEASRVSVFNNLQPVLTSILAFGLFGTVPTVMFVVGGAIAIAGVVVTQRD
jgi:drug/metabolite transporter (DMT)-like permease